MADPNKPSIGRGRSSLFSKAFTASAKPLGRERSSEDDQLSSLGRGRGFLSREGLDEAQGSPSIGRGRKLPDDEESPSVGRGKSYHIAPALTSFPSSSSSPSGTPFESSRLGGTTSSGYMTSEMKAESSPSSSSSGGRGLRLKKLILESKDSEMGVGRGHTKMVKHTGSITSSDSPGGSTSLSESLAAVQVTTKDEKIDKQGSVGTQFSGTCNWIRVAVDQTKAVFEYHVKFVPPVDALNARFYLIKSLASEFGNVRSFDGAMLWLPQELPHQTMEFPGTLPHSNEKIKVVVTLVKKSSMDKCIQLYNVLFRRVLKILKMVSVGRNHFLPEGSVSVPQHSLEIWPGYVTAVHEMDGGVMLCVDTSHRVLRSKTVYELMAEIFNKARNKQEEANRAIIGTIVLTRYNNKTYRVDDILYDSSVRSTFTNSRGEELSYVEYYKKAYNIDIKDQNQILLVHKLKKKEQKDLGKTVNICLVPELCYATGLTDSMRADFRVMKDLAQHTRLAPMKRQASILKFIQSVNNNVEACQVLSDWGLHLMNRTESLCGRTLDPEVIIFGGKKQTLGSPDADWNRDTMREKVIEPVDIPSDCWAVVFPRQSEKDVREFVSQYIRISSQLGIHVGSPIMESCANDSIETYISTLRRLCARAKPALAIIIFPTQREDRYSAVKRFAAGDVGFPTQVINMRTIRGDDRKLRSVVCKIALQINCKLGGRLWEVKIPLKSTMVCGVDVYHDAVSKGKSVVGFVASLNPSITQWFSLTTFQNHHEEIINGLRTSFMASLKAYREHNGSYPTIVLMFRDGVGDGMMNLTKEHEIPQMTSVFRTLEGCEPQLYYIIVQKRINTKIFAEQERGVLGNPHPGSIIDHTITRPCWYDFFLVSQHVNQGTVSPTHYVVLQKGARFTPDQIQKITYKLTHLYYNWPGTIRVPAPCMYAHKLAYLVGQNIRKDVHDSLCKRLHFL